MRLTTVCTILIAILAAACDSTIPTVPPITVFVTAVDDTTALADGVAQALTGTAFNSAGLTETQFARQGITLTPTPTATATATPLPPTVTSQLAPSASYTPSKTPTATFAPFPTNVFVTDDPAQTDSQGAARLRVLNAWVDNSSEGSRQVDVYINEVRVAHALDVRQGTAYQRVTAGTSRVSLYPVQSDPAVQLGNPPLLSQTVNVSTGASVSLVIADLGQGMSLVPVLEDSSPLSSGMSRLTLLQANPSLLEVNVLVPSARRVLASDLPSAGIVGPIDLPRDQYRLELYDSVTPELLVTDVNNVNLIGQVNHLLVFVPPPPDGTGLTDTILFTGSTRLVETDVNVRFINAASDTGTLSFAWEGRTQIPLLGVGSASVAVPLSGMSTVIDIINPQGTGIDQLQLGPWPSSQRNDKMVVLLNSDTSLSGLGSATFSQDAPTSPIRANVRLINALPDTVPLALQVSVPGATTEQGGSAWEVLVANVRYGESSDYAGRAPGLYDVRVVLTGTSTEIAILPQLQLLAGGTYQFIVVPGTEQGRASLLLIQPEVQVGLVSAQAGPDVLSEVVNATLTAMVTPDADTPTPVRTPTSTVTPVPTNTPHPTNTPSVPPPALLIDPAPPNAASGAFTVVAVNFAPGERYSIRLDNERELQTGRTDEEGNLVGVVNLPANTTPGPHIVQLCVDCGLDGLQQVEFAVIIVADPNATATPTPIS
jgi:hypothetical protein